MEPVTGIGLAASIFNIVDVIASSLSTLRAIQLQWQGADRSVSALVVQLSTLKAALNQICQWLSSTITPNPRFEQLVVDFKLSIQCCEDLVLFIDEQVSKLKFDGKNSLTLLSKVKAVMNDYGVRESIGYLNNQTMALNLLLTALNCQSNAEQKSLLEERQSKDILNRIKDDSSSLICLKDTSSYTTSRSSISTGGSSLLSRTFDFDDTLQSSAVYKRQMKSLIKRAIRSDKDHKQSTFSNIIINSAIRALPRSQQTSLETMVLDKITPNFPAAQASPSSSNDTTFNEDSNVLGLRREVGILIHGSPHSGITTILKNIGLGPRFVRCSYDDAERERWRRIIISSIARDLLVLIRSVEHTEEVATQIRVIVSGVSDAVRGIPVLEFEDALKALCNTEYIKHSCKTKQYDNYYLQAIDRILSPGYLPSDQDIIHCRIKTDRELKVPCISEPLLFRFFQAPCTPLERQRFFSSSVPIIVLVVDISSYGLHTDVSADPYHSLGEEVRNLLNHPLITHLSNASIILLLNKADLFKQKHKLPPDDPFFLGRHVQCLVARENMRAKIRLMQRDTDRVLYPLFINAFSDDVPSLIEQIITKDLGRRYWKVDNAASSGPPQIETVESITRNINLNVLLDRLALKETCALNETCREREKSGSC